MKELKLFKQGKKTMTSLEVTELINQFRAKEYEIKKKNGTLSKKEIKKANIQN